MDNMELAHSLAEMQLIRKEEEDAADELEEEEDFAEDMVGSLLKDMQICMCHPNNNNFHKMKMKSGNQ
eukprot:880472-Ditylum_brightwellii.AAC.1